MKPLKSKVSITLDSDIIAQLKELAENDYRSFSQFINMILKEYLTQKNKEAYPFVIYASFIIVSI